MGIGLALAVVFLASVLTAVLPPRTLDPEWQLRFASSLVNNASLAVVAGVLHRLAIALDRSGGRLRGWTRAMRHAALLPAAGTAVPAAASAAGHRRLEVSEKGITAGQERQAMRSGRQLRELREAITSSGSAEQIDRKLHQLSGGTVGLSPAERRLPLAELRQELLKRAGALSAQLQRQVETRSRGRPDVLIRESLRMGISALAYAFCLSLLGGLDFSGRRPSPSTTTIVDEHYFETVSRQERSPFQG